MNKKNLLLAIPALYCFCVFAGDDTPGQQPQQAALKFNQWYIKHFNDSDDNLLNSKEIEIYVAKETLETLRHARNNDDEFYDADFFIKAQDIMPDWPTHTVVTGAEYDPVCTQVYVSFGQHQTHGVIDCMMKESGRWKIRSVARQPPEPALRQP
ncbi:DUF3828 domain-containing protein [Cronobacter dublinensis]|uniref:DUF3828 domain-containing protein n=1 Tax=Cronobacter dublinensis TaxID=413497 RepID=UPI0035168D9D